ncbi:LacI family DNA-binding transcriptional regulator [Nocardia carnea]|uniref:LacI family DNA-binding transcriptional regulator n=1 Tax=Nocardia carnea TaxID=37328 RepID=UPI002458E998|nr:LacI family DNA-binding transcriptional regulator [Nocardia carnea]
MSVKRPTLADVARRAGTSTAVVSYVMNNGPRPVSDRLRAKVVAAADALNYRPDRNAQALRRPRRWRQIGLLVPDMTMPLFGAFAGSVEIEARARDHLTMIGNTGFDPEREREFAAAFIDVGIDGLLVVGAADAPGTALICERARIPVVWVHNSRGAIDSPIVGADHRAAGRLAARHLTTAHACENLVFVGGFTHDDVRHGDRETVAQRYAGFTEVAGAQHRVVRTDLTAEGAYTAVRAFLRDSVRPPGGMVIGTGGQSAAAIRAVTDAGLRIPGDIRVVGFDADTAGGFGQITLTSVRQPIGAITRTALDRLLGEAAEPTETAESARPAVGLDTAESCGCRTYSEDTAWPAVRRQ